MEVKILLGLINKTCNDSNWANARQLIENNIDQLLLDENKNKLSDEAKVFLEIIHLGKDLMNQAREVLTVDNRNYLVRANKYADELNLKQLKYLVNEKPELFINSIVRNYLTSDTRVLVDSYLISREKEKNRTSG